MFGPKKQCDWPGCTRRIDAYGPMYCRRHEDEQFNQIWNEQVEQVAFRREWKESGAEQVWLEATIWLKQRDSLEKLLAAPDTNTETRDACREQLVALAPVFALSEEIKKADNDIPLTLVLGQRLAGVHDGLEAANRAKAAAVTQVTPPIGIPLKPSSRPESPVEESGNWANLEFDDAARKSLGLVIRYLEACRRGDVDGMRAMSGTHDGALMATLLKCADAIVPVFREALADDDVYLGMMDQFAGSEDGSGRLMQRVAVAMLNSRGGLEVGKRWTPDNVEMSAKMVVDVNFMMAAILNELINLTASRSGRDKEQAFRHFISLLQNEAAV